VCKKEKATERMGKIWVKYCIALKQVKAHTVPSSGVVKVLQSLCQQLTAGGFGTIVFLISVF
jgi:hypothetical protein